MQIRVLPNFHVSVSITVWKHGKCFLFNTHTERAHKLCSHLKLKIKNKASFEFSAIYTAIRFLLVYLRNFMYNSFKGNNL